MIYWSRFRCDEGSKSGEEKIVIFIFRDERRRSQDERLICWSMAWAFLAFLSWEDTWLPSEDKDGHFWRSSIRYDTRLKKIEIDIWIRRRFTQRRIQRFSNTNFQDSSLDAFIFYRNRCLEFSRRRPLRVRIQTEEECYLRSIRNENASIMWLLNNN